MTDNPTGIRTSVERVIRELLATKWTVHNRVTAKKALKLALVERALNFPRPEE